MRHQPFSNGRAERDAWMRHMRDAIDSAELAAPVREAFLEYFENAATAMMNRGGPPF
jgi:hemoglobin